MTITSVPQIPVVPGSTDPALTKFLQAIRETLLVREGQKGNILDSSVTFRDLVDAGVAVSSLYTPNPNTLPVVDAAAVSDLTPPPTPTNVTIAAGISNVMISWDIPTTRSNLSYVKIWRSGNSLFSNATLIGTGSGNFYVDYAVTEGSPYHYWLQSVSIANVDGTLVAVGSATPATDPSGALTQLKAYGVKGLPYYYLPTDVTINGVTLHAGTYMWDAVIGTAAIGTAQIKDASITNAKIASLTADKITFNQAAGQILTAAVINGAVITGTTSISAPTITGAAISTTTLSSSTINSTIINGGEIYVPSAASWRFKVDSAGNLEATNVNLTGNINATSGTFSGTLNVKSAASGARLEIYNNVIKVFDSAGTLRVKLGDLSA
jgi:hypothetical protein